MIVNVTIFHAVLINPSFSFLFTKQIREERIDTSIETNKKSTWQKIATYQNGIENADDAYNTSDQVYIDVAHYNELSSILMIVD